MFRLPNGILMYLRLSQDNRKKFFHLENTDVVKNAAYDSQPRKRETRKNL